MLSYSGFYFGQRVAHNKRYGVITGIVEREGAIRFVVKLDLTKRLAHYSHGEIRAVRTRRGKER